MTGVISSAHRAHRHDSRFLSFSLGTVHYTFNYDNLMKSTTNNDGFMKLITPPRKAICIDTMLSLTA